MRRERMVQYSSFADIWRAGANRFQILRATASGWGWLCKEKSAEQSQSQKKPLDSVLFVIVTEFS